jgi:molecular chaperone GrpE
VVSKEESKEKVHESVEQQQNDRQEHGPEGPGQADPNEAEVGKEEHFDPETADRVALLEKYRELQEEIGQTQERVLRTAADAENFKRRIEREKEEQTRYANESIIRELLPVIDNLERALDHSQDKSDPEGLVEGLNMILKGFMDTLDRFGCKAVEAMSKAFDPNFHEAVSQEESEKYPANTVLRELQKGYMLKERLLRPAMVVVSKPPIKPVDDMQEAGGLDAEEKSTNKVVKIKVHPA